MEKCSPFILCSIKKMNHRKALFICDGSFFHYGEEKKTTVKVSKQRKETFFDKKIALFINKFCELSND